MSVEQAPTRTLPDVAHDVINKQEHDDHGKRPYIAVFFWLFLLTAIEVSTAYIPHSVIPHTVIIPILLVLAVAKATMVAMYYMHLKYDPRLLSIVFVGPFGLAVLFSILLILGGIR